MATNISFSEFLSSVETVIAEKFNLWEAKAIMADPAWYNNVFAPAYDAGADPKKLIDFVGPTMSDQIKDNRKYGPDIFEEMGHWPSYRRCSDNEMAEFANDLRLAGVIV